MSIAEKKDSSGKKRYYKVDIIETYVNEVYVEAESWETAKEIVDKKWENGDYETTGDMFSGVDYGVTEATFSYYCLARPVGLGTVPNDFVHFTDTDFEICGHHCWGIVEYDRPLTQDEICHYELTPKEKYN